MAANSPATDSTSDTAAAPPVVKVEAPPTAHAETSTASDALLIDPGERSDPSAFRGRENYTNAGDVLAWIPRVVFFPLYLVTEFLLRRPITAIAGWVDRNHVIPIINDILNPTPDIQWNPTLALDFGSFVALGAEGRWRNFVVHGHEISSSVLVGGLDGYRFTLRDSWQVGPSHFGVRGGGSYHQDRRFYGFGPNSVDTNETGPTPTPRFFSETRYEAFAFVDFDYRNHVHFEAAEGFRGDLTGPGYSPPLESIFEKPTGGSQSVPGFGAQMDLAMAMLDVKLDTRRAPLEPSGGARLTGNVTYARDVADPERSFVTTELDGEVAAEISKPDRVLSLRGYAVDTFALGREPVPFCYQAMLGFDHHLGFIWGRFRDASALMAELRYHHPIAYFIDMQWIASVGNVFGQNFADFKPGSLTGSLAVGLRTRRTGALPLEILVGLGTSRFDEAFAVDSIRVYLATTESL